MRLNGNFEDISPVLPYHALHRMLVLGGAAVYRDYPPVLALALAAEVDSGVRRDFFSISYPTASANGSHT